MIYVLQAPVKFLQYSTSVVTRSIAATANTRVVIDADNNHATTLAKGKHTNTGKRINATENIGNCIPTNEITKNASGNKVASKAT